MKKFKNNITELVFILDRSGSMFGLEADTVGGFNSMIQKQNNNEGKVYVSTVLFNSRAVVLHDREEIDKISPMTKNDYQPNGSTALLDAVGDAIHHIGNIHKYARPEDVPEHTMFVITTDGMENASRKYTYEKLRSMIEKQKEKYGWEFLFVGANIDAVSVASNIGISENFAANYCSDKAGTGVMWESLSEPVTMMRSGKAFSRKWAERMEDDARKRSRK